MSSLLVLYPLVGDFRRELVSQARKIEDVRLVLADDHIPASDYSLFDEVIEVPPPQCLAEAHEILQRWCHKNHPEGVYLQSEVALLLGSLLVRESGLAGPPPEAAHACTNKYLSRVVLSQAGVPTPRFGLTDDAAGVRRLAREFGYPVVLKGVASTMSRLVIFIKNESEVEDAVAYIRSRLPASLDIIRLASFARAAKIDLGCDPPRQFLVESFVEGDAVETDGLVVKDKIYTFGVIEQVMTTSPRFYFEGYLIPAEFPGMEVAKVRQISNAALAAVGLRDSGFSIEMRTCNGEVCVIEINGRLGWDEGLWELFETRINSPPLLHTLKIALGMETELTVDEKCCAAVAYRNCYRNGVVERLPKLEELGQFSTDGFRLGLATEEGARFFAPPHPEAYPHVAWALTTHPVSSRAAYVAARKLVDKLDVRIKEV